MWQCCKAWQLQQQLLLCLLLLVGVNIAASWCVSCYWQHVLGATCHIKP
jgi:hypothetical protein